MVYNVKGINWFGGETECRVPHGMWVHSLDHYLDLIRGLGFNSIRFPFSYENAVELDGVVKPECVSASPSLYGKRYREVIHTIMSGASDRGMSVLLDFHTIGGVITEFPSTEQISEDQYLDVWVSILREFARYPNLIGVDLKNEPHGNIRWPVWGDFVNKATRRIKEQVPEFQGLFFVEGIQDPNDRSVWGGSFSRMDHMFGETPDPRIVFSPHVYGVSVRGVDAVSDSDERWVGWFAYLPDYFMNAVCIGEVGGWFEGDDRIWHYNLLGFLKRFGIRNAYYWCLNPNSIDTGGILDMDWNGLNQDKIDFCNQLQPEPTFSRF